MASLDCMNVLQSNAVVFKDTEDTFHIGKAVFPKDGYSDENRILEYVKAGVNEGFKGSLCLPSVKGNKWGEHEFSQAYSFNKFYTTPGKTKETPLGDLRVWGGCFQTDGELVETEEGFEKLGIPKVKEYYYNIVIKLKDTNLFLDCQEDKAQWKAIPCDGACKLIKHNHMVSGRYRDQWQTTVDGVPETIYLAPPITTKLDKQLFHVDKHCLTKRIESATESFRQTLVGNGAKESKREAKATPPAKTDLKESGSGKESNESAGTISFDETFPTAFAAVKKLVMDQGEYHDLVTIIRKASNTPWRQITSVAPTKNAQIKLKNDLAAVFSSHILPLVQKTGGATLRQVLAACSKKASDFGQVKKDAVLGYLLNRLAEPIHNIVSLDGQMVIIEGGAMALQDDQSELWSDSIFEE